MFFINYVIKHTLTYIFCCKLICSGRCFLPGCHRFFKRLVERGVAGVDFGIIGVALGKVILNQGYFIFKARNLSFGILHFFAGLSQLALTLFLLFIAYGSGIFPWAGSGAS